ncbi:c-type cytochrome [Achromobacter arsenitoxydans]|uniref:Cytochrome C n=1 Tax=Achromobacter arsenitoxydans SY8 TaxID=477184 RepID=H0F396_9BURK|nr:cytochrome c [Achromobacter arsenitoxydans]EHK67302.1 cytochrome C [Achromobacter arsenitoxydans SY8]
MVSAQWLALAAAAAGAAMMAWAGAAGRVRGEGALRLPWLAAGALGASAALLALGWRTVQDLPGLLGSRVGHLALSMSGILLLAGLGAAWLHSRAPAVRARALPSWRRGVALAMGALALLVLMLALSVWRQPENALALARWPFAWRYDPDLPVSPHTWNRLWLALAQSAAALVLLVCALFARRWRLALLAASGALALATSWPQPRLLLTEAHPMSYQRSPLSFTDANVLQGGRLYRQHCASCHGAAADGRGARAAGLPAWPSVLGAALFGNRLDGDIYWRVARDGQASGGPAEHGFGAALRPDEIWQVLDFLRLQAYGASGGAGMPAVPAPVVALACRDGRTARLDGLRGLPLRIVAHAPGAPEEPQDPRVLTVALTRGLEADVNADCVATDVLAWDAYALAAGTSPDALAGAQFMVDRRGWLRARRLPGAAPAWTSADNVCGPAGRMESTSARGLGELLSAMDSAPIAAPARIP